MVHTNARLGLRYAQHATDFFTDVRVLLWSKAEDEVAEGKYDDKIANILKKGGKVFACKGQAGEYGEKLKAKGIELVSASEMLSRSILEGYPVVSF